MASTWQALLWDLSQALFLVHWVFLKKHLSWKCQGHYCLMFTFDLDFELWKWTYMNFAWRLADKLYHLNPKIINSSSVIILTFSTQFLCRLWVGLIRKSFTIKMRARTSLIKPDNCKQRQIPVSIFTFPASFWFIAASSSHTILLRVDRFQNSRIKE